jgi:molecular chaperone DnaK
VGIDHGTTFSAVSALLPPATVPTVVEIGQNEQQIPTSIFINDSVNPPQISVGTEADNQTANQPDCVLKWYKPKMELEPNFTFKNRTLIGIATEVIKAIKCDAEAKLNEPIDRALLTVPAWFHDPARKMTLEAARQAGFSQVELENEPTAAAFFYHKVRHLQPGAVLAVYDLGGGTFDVSILEHSRDGKLRILDSHGDMNLGGHLWTLKLQEYVAAEYLKKHQSDLTSDPSERYELYKACETCKRQLTTMNTGQVVIRPQNGPREVYKITLSQFEELTRGLLERTGEIMSVALRKASVGWDRISHVLLVGGTTRMKQIEQYVEQIAGRRPELLDNRDQIVAHGAALLMQNMAAPQLDVPVVFLERTVPHPLSTWVKRGRQLSCAVMVPAGSQVPASGRKFLRRQRDNATEIDIPVFQGGTDGATIDLQKGATRADQLFLKKYRFSGIPATPASDDEIEVVFKYSAQQTIEVEAVYKPGSPEEKRLAGREEDWKVEEATAVEAPMVAVIDCSGSMAGAKIEQAKQELARVADQYAGNGFTLSVIAFPHRIFGPAGELVRGATDPREVRTKVADLIAGGGTPMAEGLEETLILLKSLGVEGLDKFVFLITDGAPDNMANAKKAGEALKAEGVRLFAIPIDAGPKHEQFLNSFCERVQPITSASGISQAFRDLLSQS